MAKIVDSDTEITVEYCRSSGGLLRSFDLVLRYLNGTTADFTLVVEKRRSGTWKPIRAEIDLEETEADVDNVAMDLADVRWYIFSAEERGRKLPPVVALWEEGDLVLAACLSDKYSTVRLPLAAQMKWFESGSDDEFLDPERLLCWWPDSNSWSAIKQSVSYLKSLPTNELLMNFFTFDEWFRRIDVVEEMDDCLGELKKMEEDPDLIGLVMADVRAEEYARYIRSLRTALLHCQKKGVPVKLVLGDVSKAEAFFADKKLDPLDPGAWAAASWVFEPMPEFVIERSGPCGPLGTVVSGQRLKAAVSFITYWPDVAVLPDAVGAAVFAGARHVDSLFAWVNPLAGQKGVEKAMDALLEEIFRRGVEDVAVIDAPVPFEACPCCGRLTLRAPDEWNRRMPVRSEKIGRNDPCPCGSGLKYKKCCGKPS